MDSNARLIAGLQAAWKREIAGAKTYRALAQHADTTEQRDILNRLAEAEERHAETWTARLKELGSAPPTFGESFVERARRWVLVQLGTETALATSFVISTLAHFVVGVSKVIVTGRSWWKSGLEMTVVGLGEATITYVIGLLIASVVG